MASAWAKDVHNNYPLETSKPRIATRLKLRLLKTRTSWRLRLIARRQKRPKTGGTLLPVAIKKFVLLLIAKGLLGVSTG